MPRSCPSFTFRCIVLQAASCTGSQRVEWAIWLVMTPLEPAFAGGFGVSRSPGDDGSHCLRWVCLLCGHLFHDSPFAGHTLGRAHAVFLRVFLRHHVSLQYGWMVLDPHLPAASWVDFPLPDHVCASLYSNFQPLSLCDASLLLHCRSDRHDSFPRGRSSEFLHHRPNHQDASPLRSSASPSLSLALAPVPV